VSELALAVFAASRDAHASEGESRSARFARFAAAFDGAAYIRDLDRQRLRWVARSAAEFPERLASIHDPPPGLFLRGGGPAGLLSAPTIAIVGARSCTDYGAHVARSLARELAAAGVAVVSGLARGIDGWAHRGALDAGGTTVAVLGCGVDRDYPRAHAALAAQIAERGLIVSEYPPGVAPAPWRFPARNRVIAGLAQATLVVEARERSGALITADFALEEGREVLAVPGEITSALSAGTNALLALGAKMVTNSADVLELFGLAPTPVGHPPLGPAAGRVLGRLGEAPASVDELGHALELDAGTLAAALSELELHGLVDGAAGIYRACTSGPRPPPAA
jgi:DNA processing protein